MEYKELLDNAIEKIYSAKFEEAIELLNKSIELKNDFEVSYFYRAVAYHSLEKYTDAILDYTKTIKLNPKMTDAYYNRAKIIIENKNSTISELTRAKEDLKTALEQDEKFVDALYAMACTEKKLGEYHSALEYLERLLNIVPDAIHAKALKKLILTKYIVRD